MINIQLFIIKSKKETENFNIYKSIGKPGGAELVLAVAEEGAVGEVGVCGSASPFSICFCG